MKKLIYILLCLPVLGFAQPMEWKHMNIHLNCVNFGGPNNGVAVGANSAIMYTTDGGETWIGGRSPLVGSLSSVSMADASTGWIVGVNGSGLTATPIILKTTDGGANWTRQTSPVANLSLRSVYAVSSTVAFIACGEGGPIASTLRSTVLKTTDGGATWTDLITATPTSSPALDTSMWGISCSNTTYLASFRSIKMIDANTGYVVGGMNSTGCTQSTNMQQNRNGGKVWKTTDGGSTWMKVHMLPSNNAGFRGVDFGASGQYGFVCGNVPSVQNGVPSRSLYRTSDYGATWEFVETGVVTAMNNVRMDNENTIFLSTGAGTKGIIRSTINAQVSTVLDTSAATGVTYMVANATFASDTVHQTAGVITYVSSRVNKFAVGSFGLIFKGVDGTPTPTNPSGITWAIKNGGEVLNPYDGYFHDQNNGFIGSDGGRILSSTDGFSTYTTTQVPTGGPFMAGPINAVVFTDAMTGYAAGNGSGIATVAVKTVDGGATWTAMTLPSGVVVQNDISFPSPTTGYFVGNSSASNQPPVVNKLTIVGGTPNLVSVSPTNLTWTGSTFTNAIFFLNDLVGWVVANGGKIIKTTDGGATWAYQTLPIVPPATVPLTTNLNDVWFADLSTGFIAGNSGKIFKTTDGGATWLEQTTPYTGAAVLPGLQDLEFFDANKGFAVGSLGAWIYTENGGTTWSPVSPNLASCTWWFISKAPGAAQTDLIMGAVNLVGNGQTNIQRSNMTRYFPDGDMDGYGGAAFVESFFTTAPSGYVAAGGDCDDANDDVNPGATEICNSIDDDCDTVVDEDGPTWYADTDADSYGDAASTINSCATSPSGYVANDDDCDDTDDAIHPAATEIADDAVDQNCDTDELCFTDADNDGYRPDATSTTVSDNLVCTDPNEAVSADPTTDCNDANAAINPAAAETCNSMDDDCDTMTDESGGTPSFLDGDGDTYGTPATSSTACTAPSGYVANDDDCNDTNAAIKPGATETCNGIDDNCDALIDNLAVCPLPTSVTISNISSNAAQFNWLGGCTTGWQISYRPVTSPVSTYIVVNVAAPATSKVISGLTPNTQYQYRMRSSCTGNTYSAYTTIKSFWTVSNVNTYFQDADGDTFGNPSATANGTTAPSGYVSNSNDCDDTNAAVKPGAIELCNGTDDNCDGIVDNVAACPKPVGLSTSGITSTEATANWGSVVCATSFDVQYKKVGTSGYTTLSAGAGSVSAAMTGLLPGTNYHWRIRAKCPGNKNSAYTALTVFSTPATSAAPGATTEVTANEEVATEERGNPASAEATVSIEQLFPNPATETIHLVLATETERSVQVLVTNAVGQVVRRQSFDLGDGASVLEISVDGLPAGAYQVSVAGTAGSRTFVKI